MNEDISESNSLLLNLTSTDYREKKNVDKSKDHDLITDQTLTKISKFAKEQKSQQFLRKSNEENSKKKSHQLQFSSLFTHNLVIPPLEIKQQKSVSEPLFSAKTFSDINLHPHLVACLKQRLDISRLTKVQEQTIPLLLDGQDALVKSCTGSGKTLAYAVPIVHNLQEKEPKVKRSDGVYALVIVPTRELALQCFETFSTLTKSFTWIVPGYLIGGEKKKSEKARLRKGINILISTPGRLLDHLDHTTCLSLENISWLVIDEADRLLEQGFEASVRNIVHHCNQNRRSVLLSATLSNGVQLLAGMSLSNPVHVDISNEKSLGDGTSDFQDFALPNSLKQFVVVVPPKQRLIILSGFIIDICLKGLKGLVFMCSLSSVDFHYSLLSDVLASCLIAKDYKCKFFRLHGNMKQEERTEIFSAFKSVKEGILFCTDVAARGLDLPSLDWIVQFSAPPSAEIYVHRVGRTARIGKKGNALLFLLPEENKFSNVLADHKINVEEIPVTQYMQSMLILSDVLLPRRKASAEECAAALQIRYENAVYEEYALHQNAKDAFASYVQSYVTYPKNIRHALPFHALNLGHIAKSYCLREAPSNLGGPLPNSKRFHRKKSPDKKSLKRKFQDVSEYHSGLSSVTLNVGKKPKRKKH